MSIDKILHDSIRKVFDTCAKNIVVAYSGGIDSHVLLHLVATLRPEFPQHQYSAKHINHGLSQHADSWAVHCQQICAELDFECSTVNVDVDVNSNQGLEAAARDARYTALLADTQTNTLILLAQHADDQLETFLLQLKRGAGPKGLAAMPVESAQSNKTSLVRPFLALDKDVISRKEIEDYAELNKLDWVEDESNLNTRFDRNFLRQRVLPNLTQRWPELAKSVQRSARLCAQQQALLDEVVSDKLLNMLDSRKRLDIKILVQCSKLWQAQILRYWLEILGASMPSEAVLSEIQQMLSAREDANPVVEWNLWQVRRYQNYLYLLTDVEQNKPQNITVTIGEKTNLPKGFGWVCVETQSDIEPMKSIEICFGGFALKFKPINEKFSKPIKQWLQRWEIEPWCRQTIPLLFIDGELVAILLEETTIFAEKGSNVANQSLQKSLKRSNAMPL